MAGKTRIELLQLVDTYVDANTASNSHLRLDGADAEYEEGYSAGLSDARDALAESVAIAGKLVRLFTASATPSAYDRGYLFALTDVVYIIDNGVLPGMSDAQTK
jgi:hypothetical protein